MYRVSALLSSAREKYARDDGHPHDDGDEQQQRSSVPAHTKNYRFRTHQFLVSLVLVFVLGASVQVHKLSALDASGREFRQTTTKDKTMFLVPFAIAKATSNLFSGSMANRFGRKRVGIFGWMISVVAPMLAMSAVTRRTADESDNEKWNRIVASGFFLGVGQGIGWTMAIMTSVDVSGPTQRGFASGMCETVGYTAVAIFAAMYAALEETRATCHWEEAYRPKDMRTEACIRANPEGKCGVGDDWVEACSGMCNCEGYIERPSTVVFVMSMIGLVVICVFGRETGLSSDRNRSNRSNRNNNGRVSLQVRELETPGGDHDDGSFVQMTMRMNLERQASYKEEIRTHLPPSPLASRSNKKNKEMNNRQIIRIRSRARLRTRYEIQTFVSSPSWRFVATSRLVWRGVCFQFGCATSSD